MYPYNLLLNPFPSGPTPTLKIAKILGGRRHKEALNSIINCINDLCLKSNDDIYSNDELFKVITVIQDIGSGKTHLALHMKTIPHILDKVIISYIDLVQVHPRDIDTIFSSIIKGFTDEYFKELLEKLVEFLKRFYSTYPKLVKKIIKYGFFDSLNGNPIEEKLKQFLEKKIQPSFNHLFELLSNDFSKCRNSNNF